jgi:ribose transport system permease protein
LRRIPPVLWFVLALMAVFTISSDRYLTVHNVINIFQQGAVLLIVACGMTMVILSGGLDLSLGGVLTFSGITSVLTLNLGLPVALAVVVGLLTGAASGAISGLLVSVVDMPPFIATLGMQGVLFGLSLALTHSTGVLTSNPAFLVIGGNIAGYVPMAAVCAAFVYLVVLYVLHNTAFGRYTVAIGGNETGARLSGVSTMFWKWMVYVFAGVVTGAAGVVLASRLEVADPIVGVGWEFDAIAAAILGGTSFKRGKGDVSGTIVGVLLIAVVRNGLNVIRAPSFR